MGGTGTSISSGIEAAFINPANLMIRNHRQGFLIHLGHLSYQNTDVVTDLDRIRSYTDAMKPFLMWDATQTYPSYADPNGHSAFDHLIAGFSYTSPGFGISLGWRVRGENTWTAGSGWTTTEFSGEGPINDRALSQQLSVHQEIALGFAWEYELISGWLTDLSKLFVGVNPKVIIPGMYVDQSLMSTYSRTESGIVTHIGSYNLLSAGRMGTYAALGGAGPLLSQADLMTPTGIGGGLDMGFTYIIGLGNEQSLGIRRKDQTRNSIRFSASITDLGFVSYSKNPVRRASDTLSTANAVMSDVRTGGFVGSPGHFEAILTEADTERATRDRAVPGQSGPINLALPAMLRGGAALQLNRFLVTGDIHIPLTTHPYYGDTRSIHLGTEVKLLRMLPLRGGISLNENLTTVYSAGFGLDFRNIDLSLATQFQIGSRTPGAFEPIGLSVAAMQIRF
jgi:hypothetical protein